MLRNRARGLDYKIMR
ncbi:hypothetical protein BOZ38_RS01680 [Escherichia coli]|nr:MULTISPECIES: hypothetical protein [Escherichia]MCH0693536.1 hypothetical protein [Escherichia coli]MDX8117299.1 hypothetical protein [Escherichia coli]